MWDLRHPESRLGWHHCEPVSEGGVDLPSEATVEAEQGWLSFLASHRGFGQVEHCWVGTAARRGTA